MKKDNVKISKGLNDEGLDKSRKQAAARVPQRPSDGLTCNEAQVDALLSDGESI